MRTLSLRSAVLLSVGAAFGLGACGAREVAINERIYEQDVNGLIIARSSGCAMVRLEDSPERPGPAEPTADMHTRMRGTPSGVAVEVFSESERLESRTFTEATLISAQVQSFSVRTHAGEVFEFRYWGGQCDALELDRP
jgi:hypothetical protein